ncbi:hypothetical protein FGG08_007519 [Glutinoglossum americanum]|uniref:F-box domain-containing protein n=1 Tax=Glutinoglossum americanum TaxID=1670608 RepID=A0A9P8HYM4_9PEZI|nr:hypothetical protein FGG08_007519 [Glutinoglossum americanum]
MAVDLLDLLAVTPADDVKVKASPAMQGRMGDDAESKTPMAKLVDPFRVLDDLCLSILIDHLRLRELIHCSGVSRLWRARLDIVLMDSRIRTHFPFYNPLPNVACDKRVSNLRRLALRESSLSHAKPTWHGKIHGAERYSMGAHFAAWSKVMTSEINWINLPHTRAKSLKLSTGGSFQVEDVLVNDSGVLFVRGVLEGRLGRMWRDQAYQLTSETLLWRKDTLIPKRTKPLFLSPKRAYFLYYQVDAIPRTVGLRLQAVSLARGDVLYELEISPIPLQDFSRSMYKFLHLRGRDYIIDLSWKHGFSIIDGKTGTVLQQVKHKDVCGYNVMAVPNTASREFILWSPPLCVKELTSEGLNSLARRVTVEKFTLGIDGKFACTRVRTVHASGANFVVHPYEDYGFSLGIQGLNVLKIIPDTTDTTQDPPVEGWMGQRYRVSESKLVEALWIGVRWWEPNRPVVILNEGRVMFDDTEGDDRTLHIMEFGPKGRVWGNSCATGISDGSWVFSMGH